MTRPWLLVALAVAAAPAAASAGDRGGGGTATKPTGTVGITEEQDAPPQLSLPTESDRVAWTRPGFRLGLALEYGRLDGLRGAPSGRLLGAVLHAGLRLDADWSLMTTFVYASASQHGGLSGLRFAGTLDPTWHVTRSLSLAFGVGFGGIVEGSTGRKDNPDQPTDHPITLTGADPPVGSCSGVGLTGLARAAYSWVIGPRATTMIELELLGQYTSCTERRATVDPDTGQPITRTQYWPQAGATLAWGFEWR